MSGGQLLVPGIREEDWQSGKRVLLSFLALLLLLVIPFSAWYGGLFATRALIHNYDSAYMPVIGFGLLTVAGLLTAASWHVFSRWGRVDRRFLRNLFVGIVFALPACMGGIYEANSF